MINQRAKLQRYPKNNGYNEKSYKKAIEKHQKGKNEKDRNDENIIKSIRLPYIQRIMEKISIILWKNQIRVALLPLSTLRKMMDHAKDQIEPMKNKGVYSIPCDYRKIYISETSRLVLTRLKEHNSYIFHGRTKKYALAKHSLASKHHIHLENA